MIAAVLCGATAVGKSALALRLAKANGFEILSADSRQVYRGFRIGTGAPSQNEGGVVHHLVGCLDPQDAFSPREYPSRAREIIAAHPDTRFLVVGGTGLYLKELLYPSPFDRGPTPDDVKQKAQDKIDAVGSAQALEELRAVDAESAEGLHPNDAYRIAKRWENLILTGESYSKLTGPLQASPDFASVPVIWMDVDRQELYRRIEARIDAMLRDGWLEETRALLSAPGASEWPVFTSLGYSELADFIAGRRDFEATVTEIKKRTRNYAKRQTTFFRHQLPVARRWEAPRLESVLEQCRWDWDRFMARIIPPPD